MISHGSSPAFQDCATGTGFEHPGSRQGSWRDRRFFVYSLTSNDYSKRSDGNRLLADGVYLFWGGGLRDRNGDTDA
jgi:hypothetical protein